MATLTLSPDWSVSKTTRLTPFESRLGDGYGQHISITAYRPVWSVSRVFQARERQEALAAYYLLRGNQGDEIFQWSPGFGIPEFDCYCKEWSIAELGEPRAGQKIYKITGEFEEAHPWGETISSPIVDHSNYGIVPFSRNWEIEKQEAADITIVQYKGGVIARDRNSYVHPIAERMTLTGPVYDFATVDGFFRGIGGKPFRLENKKELWRCNEWTLSAVGAANHHRGARWNFSGEITRVYRGIDEKDRIPPLAVLQPIPTVTSGTYVDINIEYIDAGGIDESFLGTGDITVFYGPTGRQNPLFINYSNGVATYRMQAPGGFWDSSDNGFYSIVLNADQVFDLGGNPAYVNGFNGFLGSFQVNSTVTADLTRPTSSLVSSQNITTKNGASIIRVQFSDANLNQSTVSGGEIRVINGNRVYTPGFVSQTNGLATYQLSPPNVTGWDDQDLTYSITVVANAVADNSGNTNIAATLGSLTISVDRIAPAASLANVDTITDDQSDILLVVTYSDPRSGIDQSSVTTGNLEVRNTLNNVFFATPELISFTQSNGIGTATYRINNPVGGWVASNDGTYNVLLLINQIRDNAGNYTEPRGLGSFDIITNSASLVPMIAAAV